MLKVEDPLGDVQQRPPVGFCRICRGELDHYDPWPLCRECKEEQDERDD